MSDDMPDHEEVEDDDETQEHGFPLETYEDE